MTESQLYKAESGWRYWINEYFTNENLLTFASPKLSFNPSSCERDLVIDCLVRTERAARLCVLAAEMNLGVPHNGYRRGDCRIPGHYVADLIQVLSELQQISDYYRSPMPTIGDEYE